MNATNGNNEEKANMEVIESERHGSVTPTFFRIIQVSPF